MVLRAEQRAPGVYAVPQAGSLSVFSISPITVLANQQMPKGFLRSMITVGSCPHGLLHIHRKNQQMLQVVQQPNFEDRKKYSVDLSRKSLGPVLSVMLASSVNICSSGVGIL